MRTASVIVLAGCWTGSAVVEVPRTTNAEIRAIRKCSPLGPQLLILRIQHRASDFTIEVDYQPGKPLGVVTDGEGATFSPCTLHGCDATTLVLDELVIGKRASGRYTIRAKAGATYLGEFEARWVGIPWMVDCPVDPI